MHKTTVRVVDDHELLSAEQMVRDDQGPQRVVGNDAPGIADDVRVASLEAHRTNGQARIHASENRELALRAWTQRAQFVRARINLVCFKDFIYYAHGQPSLTKCQNGNVLAM